MKWTVAQIQCSLRTADFASSSCCHHRGDIRGFRLFSGPEEGKITERTPDEPNLGYSVHMELKKDDCRFTRRDFAHEQRQTSANSGPNLSVALRADSLNNVTPGTWAFNL